MSFADIVMSVRNRREMGHPFSAACTAAWNFAGSAPGTFAATSSRGLELRGVRAGDLRGDVEVDGLHRPARVGLVEVQGRLRVDAFRAIPELLEFAGEGHREAAGVRGGDEFLRVRPGRVSEAHREAVRNAFQGAARRRYRAFPISQAARPLCTRLPVQRITGGRNRGGDLTLRASTRKDSSRAVGGPPSDTLERSRHGRPQRIDRDPPSGSPKQEEAKPAVTMAGSGMLQDVFSNRRLRKGIEAEPLSPAIRGNFLELLFAKDGNHSMQKEPASLRNCGELNKFHSAYHIGDRQQASSA